MLNGPYSDKALMRNVLAYELAAEISYPVGEETSATFMSM